LKNLLKKTIKKTMEKSMVILFYFHTFAAMLRLVSHIEHLLRIHDCVIVPQLGGFVLQVVPAVYVEEEHLFRPMHKEVVFNAKLKHNDGLLSERYMEAYKVTFQRACRMLEEDVAVIRELLLKGVSVSLGNVGSLSTGKEGQTVFHTGDARAFSIDSYGLSPFQLKTWQTLQLEYVSPNTIKEVKNTFYIPVNRNILRAVAASAAAIALFLMVSTPVKEVSQSGYTASFVPAITSTKVVSAPPSTGLSPETALSASSSRAVLLTPSTTPSATPSRTITLPVNKPSAVQEASNMFYVVIASVGSRQQANDFISYNIDFSVMKNANILEGDGKIRIYADKFADRNMADACLAKIRQNPQFYDAWLYTKKK
jgi:hypothetical protein